MLVMQEIYNAPKFENILLRFFAGKAKDLPKATANDFFYTEGYLDKDGWYDYNGRLIQKLNSKHPKNTVTHWAYIGEDDVELEE